MGSGSDVGQFNDEEPGLIAKTERTTHRHLDEAPPPPAPGTGRAFPWGGSLVPPQLQVCICVSE